MLKGALVPETTLEGRPPGEKKLKKAKQAVNQEKKEAEEARAESKKRGREAMENAALLMACKEMGWHMPALEKKVYAEASHWEEEARCEQQELYEQDMNPDDAPVQQPTVSTPSAPAAQQEALLPTAAPPTEESSGFS